MKKRVGLTLVMLTSTCLSVAVSAGLFKRHEWCSAPRQLAKNDIVFEKLELVAQAQRDSVEFYAALLAAKQIARQPGVGRDQVIAQSALFDATRAGRRTLRDVSLILNASDRIVLNATLPHYDPSGGDAGLSKLLDIRYQLSSREYAEHVRSDEVLTTLTDFVQGHPDAPPWHVVRALYRKAPSFAFVQLTRGWKSDPRDRKELRELSWAEHLVADVVWKSTMQFLKRGEAEAASLELEKLSQSKDWWVRLYVAEMLIRYPQLFPAPEIRARLRSDTVPVVVETINESIGDGMSEEERTGRQPPEGRD